MSPAKRRYVTICKGLSIFWILSILLPVTAYAEYVMVSDTYEAGTKGNGVVFTVRNNTNQRLSGVRMTPEFPLRYSTITGITPKSTILAPGESVDFTIEFSVHADAPDGAEDSITLFFENNEKVEIDNPRYQINIDIVGVDEKRKHNIAYFKVLVRGSGYTFTYGDGTYEVNGSEERYIVVNRGQSATEKLEELKESIDGIPCERVIPGYVEGEVSAPGLFISGSQITIVDGPYYDYNEFFRNVKFEKKWRINGKKGPSPKEMAKRIGCQ